jgi:phosphogluconate dehydratase
MPLDSAIAAVTDRIRDRSRESRRRYRDKVARPQGEGTRRAHLSCGNQAHVYAAMGPQKQTLLEGRAPNVGIVTSYNDMLSAHQPYESYPSLLKAAINRPAPRPRSRAASRPCATA